MDAYAAIEQRWGCRKYTDKPVDREMLGLILDAGRLAPSAGNLQDRSFIVIKKDQTKTAIAQACGNQTWMQSTPVIIAIISENQKLGKFFGTKGEKVYSVQDTSFSVENMLLEATNLGLGCSLVVGFTEEQLNDVLKIKAPAQIHALVTIGYPAENVKQSSKYELGKFVYFEEYGEHIANLAVAFGEWGNAGQQVTSEIAKITKRNTKGLFEKIKSLFSRKKEETPAQDHFLEERPKEEPTNNVTEIPRELPKRPATRKF